MDLERIMQGPIGRLSPRVAGAAYRLATKLPPIRRRIAAESDRLLDAVAQSLRPYRGRFATHTSLPVEGIERSLILDEMAEIAAEEARVWQQGYASGAVYHGDSSHLEFLDRVASLNSQVNPLHPDLWPSASKYEAEIVSMVATMVGGDAASQSHRPLCGTVTSGGTESILLAVKTYRDRALTIGGIRNPEMVAPSTAHAAFDKAAGYFGVKLRRIDVGSDSRADVAATVDAINRNTILLVGSAPSFPHGAVDPIAELAAIAHHRRIGFHVDACLGGFVLPWAERLGHPVPPFDFRVAGVTSMSVDTHKYGYAPKGTSVVLYRGKDLRRFQYFTATEWPGGLYFSPTLAGSRPGAASAAAWAAMISIGEAGYTEATRRILAAADTIRSGIRDIEQLDIIGDPLWVIAFGSGEVDVYRVMDRMHRRGWALNGLHHPPAVHIAVTLRHAQPGVADRFVEDLQTAVAEVAADPDSDSGLAPVYGLAANVPARALVGDLLQRYIDLIYEP